MQKQKSELFLCLLKSLSAAMIRVSKNNYLFFIFLGNDRMLYILSFWHALFCFKAQIGKMQSVHFQMKHREVSVIGFI